MNHIEVYKEPDERRMHFHGSIDNHPRDVIDLHNYLGEIPL